MLYFISLFFVCFVYFVVSKRVTLSTRMGNSAFRKKHLLVLDPRRGFPLRIVVRGTTHQVSMTRRFFKRRDRASCAGKAAGNGDFSVFLGDFFREIDVSACKKKNTLYYAHALNDKSQKSIGITGPPGKTNKKEKGIRK